MTQVTHYANAQMRSAYAGAQAQMHAHALSAQHSTAQDRRLLYAARVGNKDEVMRLLVADGTHIHCKDDMGIYSFIISLLFPFILL